MRPNATGQRPVRLSAALGAREEPAPITRLAFEARSLTPTASPSGNFGSALDAWVARQSCRSFMTGKVSDWLTWNLAVRVGLVDLAIVTATSARNFSASCASPGSDTSGASLTIFANRRLA